MSEDGSDRPRVLLADDNADMRDYVRRVLEEGGYAVHSVPDGAAALEAARAGGPFDLVLTDVMMPRLDGFGLLRQIRADERLSDLPVVMLSARAGEEASVEGLDAGADDYLIKPFGARELVARVRSNLELARLRKASTARERALRQVAEAAQEALRRLNETLEQRVETETVERRKAEASLFQAQKMEAIGQLTGGLAHDFNNLLGIIVGNLDELREWHGDGSEIGERVADALDAAMRGAELTRGLLAFARRQPLQPRHTDINEVVSDSVKLLRRMLGGNIEITTRLAADLWPAMLDPVQLEAALTNLATNARDAMPEGGRLTFVTGNRPLDEDYVRQQPGLAAGDDAMIEVAAGDDVMIEVAASDYAMIEVTDTGGGIPSEHLSRIFDPFFTTKDQGKGTGLGLSMVFGYIKQSGGHINVSSEIGVGTTIRLYLPRADAGLRLEQPSRSSLVRTGRGERVLAVEDDASLRRLLLRQLTALGYDTLEADCADAAMALLERNAVDLLFTDVVMPGGVNGVELARAALGRWPLLRVILTSGFPDLKLNGGLDAGSIRLFSKPYRKEDLARALRDALDA